MFKALFITVIFIAGALIALSCLCAVAWAIYGGVKGGNSKK